MSANATESVTVRHLVVSPRDNVFAAFSTAEAITQWFSPSSDISVEAQRFDFTPGGAYRLAYTMPDGTRPTVHGVFEEISAPERIVMTWTWEPPDPHAYMLTRVSFDLVDKGPTTEIIVRHSNLPSSEFGERYVRGWTGTLERLIELVGGDPAKIVGSTRG